MLRHFIIRNEARLQRTLHRLRFVELGFPIIPSCLKNSGNGSASCSRRRARNNDSVMMRRESVVPGEGDISTMLHPPVVLRPLYKRKGGRRKLEWRDHVLWPWRNTEEKNKTRSVCAAVAMKAWWLTTNLSNSNSRSSKHENPKVAKIREDRMDSTANKDMVRSERPTHMLTIEKYVSIDFNSISLFCTSIRVTAAM